MMPKTSRTGMEQTSNEQASQRTKICSVEKRRVRSWAWKYNVPVLYSDDCLYPSRPKREGGSEEVLSIIIIKNIDRKKDGAKNLTQPHLESIWSTRSYCTGKRSTPRRRTRHYKRYARRISSKILRRHTDSEPLHGSYNSAIDYSSLRNLTLPQEMYSY